MATVLILDNDDITTKYLAERLTDSGHDIEILGVVDHGRERIERGGINLVIMEMELPFCGPNSDPDFIPGLPLLQELVRDGIPVITFHSVGSHVSRLKVLQVKPTAEFWKPASVDKVVQKALEILAQLQPA